MKTFRVTPGNNINGDLRVASDKSISHRAIMLSSMCEGETDILNPLTGEDVRATLSAMRAFGIAIDEDGNGNLKIKGGGMSAPEHTIDCGNSGTLMRVLCGVAVGRDLPCKLIGDESLMQRPMKRVAEPLQQMGAVICTEKGKPPVTIGKRSDALSGIVYSNTLCSAQVKTALLFAGLGADGATVVAEPVQSRDHSERMLELFGAQLRRSEDGRVVELTPGTLTTPGGISIPADMSSAIFFIVAAAITPGSEILLSEVGINPSRIGGLEILRQMGADVDILNRRTLGNEPVADIRVRGGELHGMEIGAAHIPAAIDDLPALLVAAATARGETRLSGAGELRHKESDRLSAMANGLKTLRVECQETDDGIIIQGKNGGKPAFGGGTINSEGDHRIAMAFTVASLRAKSEIIINDCDNVATSFPNFVKLANSSGIRVVEEEEN